MDKEKIILNSEKELKIYMDPLRQRLLLTLEELGEPVTPKRLADTMKITPSSAKYHLTKLQSIGLVEIDHTQLIHGIKAVFYKMTNVTVSLEIDHHDFQNDKKLICDNLVKNIYSGFCKNAFDPNSKEPGNLMDGTMFQGVAHLKKEDAVALNKKIIGFLKEHETKTEDTIPFEYLVIAYNAAKNRGKDE